MVTFPGVSLRFGEKKSKKQSRGGGLREDRNLALRELTFRRE